MIYYKQIVNIKKIKNLALQLYKTELLLKQNNNIKKRF